MRALFRRSSLPILFGLISAVYLYTAAGGAICDDGDALYAHVAQQMLDRHEWVTPYANGVRFLDKPPMMYWLMAMAYQLLGISEFAARLPSVLAVLGTGCLLYLVGKRAGGHSTGFTAGIAIAFCVGTFLFTRMVFPDILFVFLLTLALSAFLEWYSDERRPMVPALLFFAALAGAVLTKGLIGVVFPVTIVLVFSLGTGEWRRLRHFHAGKGVLLFLALALPWHILAARRNPGFLWYFFVNEQLLRFLGRRQPVDYESISLPIFWGLVLLWLFPWSAFLPAIRHVVDLERHRTREARSVVLLSLIWAAVVLAFFSVSSRIEHYALPLFPPLALLVGIALTPGSLSDGPADLRRQRWVGRGFGFLALLGGLFGAVAAGLGFLWLRGWHPGAARDAVGHHLIAYKFYFAPLFALPSATLSRLFAPLLATAAIVSIGLVGAWWLNRRGHRVRAIMALSGMMMVFCLLTFHSLAVCEETLSSKQFGRVLAELYRPGDEAIAVGDFETVNSVNFYAPIPIGIYHGGAAVLEWGLRYPDAPARMFGREDLVARWKGEGRTFVLTPDPLLPELPIEGYSIVLRSGGRTLVCNRPIAPGSVRETRLGRREHHS